MYVVSYKAKGVVQYELIADKDKAIRRAIFVVGKEKAKWAKVKDKALIVCEITEN